MNPLAAALADAVRRFGIPRAPMDALVDGVEMDLSIARYPDWPALKGYCDRVAGAVGVLSLHAEATRASPTANDVNKVRVRTQIPPDRSDDDCAAGE